MDVEKLFRDIENNMSHTFLKSNRTFFEEYGHEVVLAAQEWGIERASRLFGYKTSFAIPKAEIEIPILCGYFISPDYKDLIMVYFTIKETKGKITIAKAKNNQLNPHGDDKVVAFLWSIKILRTGNFITKDILPVSPIYDVLVSRKIILPFKSMMKKKDWLALPFEDSEGLKSTAINPWRN